MSPLVLIVGRLSQTAQGVRGEPFAAGQRYFRGVARAGGTPLMLPPMPELLDDVRGLLSRVDAVVLHGGGDIDPGRYGAQPVGDGLYGIVPEHDEVELAVMSTALELDVPTLAICRGLQVLNVAMGGTLVQDIGTESHWMTFNEVVLDAGSAVAKAMGSDAPERCHCVHHQSLDQVADGLTVTGRSADGIVHAVEHDSARWVVGTQWHPEDSADVDAQQQGLFDDLIRHC